VIAGMIVGSLPFAHYLAMTRGGWKNLIEDPQVRWFAAIIATVSLLITLQLMSSIDLDFLDALRQASFNTCIADDRNRL
jgi:trk system potassium uptake protein TrkH